MAANQAEDTLKAPRGATRPLEGDRLWRTSYSQSSTVGAGESGRTFVKSTQNRLVTSTACPGPPSFEKAKSIFQRKRACALPIQSTMTEGGTSAWRETMPGGGSGPREKAQRAPVNECVCIHDNRRGDSPALPPKSSPARRTREPGGGNRRELPTWGAGGGRSRVRTP